jgi:hypothetical protein
MDLDSKIYFMKLKLIIADLDSNLLSAWSEIFKGVSEISFKNINFRTLVNCSEVNAVLLRGIFAHERYGGTPKIGESQIISTHGENEMPPWVVTTPDLPQNTIATVEEYDYYEFSKVFESIAQFNRSSKEPKICTLGFEISFLYGFRSELNYQEIKQVRKAYFEYFHDI